MREVRRWEHSKIYPPDFILAPRSCLALPPEGRLWPSGDDDDGDDDDDDVDDRSDGDHDEDDEQRPQHQEDFLVHNVQRKQAHGVRFLEKRISFLQIAVVCVLLTSTCPAELWVKKSHLVILGKTSCIGSTWRCTWGNIVGWKYELEHETKTSKTRCQIWCTIEVHRDPISKVLSEW